MKYSKKILFLTFLLLIPLNVNASSGILKQDSIIECDGIKYGYHGDDKHYHKAVEKNGKWYADGDIVENVCDGVSTESVDKENEKSLKSTEIVDKEEVENGISTDNVDKDTVTLLKCVDGDTAHFKRGNQDLKVRFLAINTPESTTKKEFYGKEASNYVCNKLTNATKIELEYDSKSDKLDKYGRTLAWIIVDNENLQLDLVKNGYAEVKYIYGDYKYLNELKSLEKEAKAKKIGMWQNYESTTNYDIYIYVGLGIILIILCLVFKNKRGAKKVFNKIQKKL